MLRNYSCLSHKIIIIIILISYFITGCGSTYISVPVTRPAEVNMSKFNKITVDDFDGRFKYYKNDFGFDLLNSLVKTKQFEVLDRNNLNGRLTELKMTYDALMNTIQNNTPNREQFGKMALVSGNIGIYDYKEKINEGTKYKDKDNDKRSHTVYSRVAQAVVSVNFKIIDLSTGIILYTTKIERFASDSLASIDKDPERIDPNNLFQHARHSIVNEFIRRILPYRDYISVQFLTDSDYPEFDKGVNFAKSGYWDDAIQYFMDATKKIKDSEIQSKAYYDLGLSYQFNFNFDKSEESFRKALSLYNDNLYISAMNNLRYFIEETNRLKEQQ